MGVRMKLAQMREYWRNLMHSTQQKLSRGASNIAKIITVAHKDQWRRK
jgi:hypothetical protein